MTKRPNAEDKEREEFLHHMVGHLGEHAICPTLHGGTSFCLVAWYNDPKADGGIHYYYSKNAKVPEALAQAADAIADEMDMPPVPATSLTAVLGMMKQRIVDYETDTECNTKSKMATALELTEFVDYIERILASNDLFPRGK